MSPFSSLNDLFSYEYDGKNYNKIKFNDSRNDSWSNVNTICSHRNYPQNLKYRNSIGYLLIYRKKILIVKIHIIR